MKTCNLFKNIFVATVILFVAGAAELWAADPQIVITYIPPIGGQGNAEGKVIWDQWTPENADQYAIIAILRTSSDYVKPTYDNYLSQISASGSFSVNITTHPNDYPEPNFSFYLVRKETFNGVNGATVTSWTMAGKYLGEPVHINRETFWNDKLKLPESNIRPGFVAAGTAVTLSCGEGETVYYTLDGSDPATVQYNGESFTVPSDGFLLIKAITRKNGKESDLASMLWMPYESYSTPLFGLNVSLALNGENFGYTLSESKTEERMKPVIPLAKWIRTFGTLNNGLPYINKIAKQAGMRTMIGVYISNSPSDNNAQLIGLRQILQTGHLPDLIAVGNEASQSGISSEIIAESVDAVRRMLKEFNLFIPVGSVDVGNMAWSQSVLNRLDFVGVNLYPSTWDCTPEEEMINVLKESYSRELSSFKSKCVLITETGTPYAKDPYTPSNTNCTQTPSENKAKSYLEEVIKWSGEDSIPLFYFEAYDEETKKGNHPIEEYFGLMDGNLKIHSFYKDVLKMSDDATLSSLTVSAGTLSPEFDVNTTGYTVNVLSDVTDITVTGTANHPSATVDGNVTDKSLEVGNTVVSITVTAEDRTTAMTYTVTVVRAKYAVTAPNAPELESKTSTSITLKEIAGAEYRKGTDGAWQDSPTFTDLDPNTAYTFYARMKETGTHEASPVSDVLSVTTEKASLSGAVTVSGTATFGQMLTAVTAGLTSIPFVVLGTLSYQWKRDGSDISGATGSTYTLAVEDVGKAVTVTVTAANCTGSITSGATAAVAKAAQSAPAAPTLADKTETSVTLNTIPGAQYRNGTDGTWQDSPTFTDLDPNTAYTFYARMKETGTHEASPVSDVLSVITFGSEAELTGLTVNGVPVSIAGDTSVYSAECDETSVVLEILSSARVTVNGAEYTGQGITLTNDLMEINIRLTSGYGQKTYDHRLKVTKALDAGLVLFQRWDDVISLILNPENNGNRNLEGVRWYRKGSEEVLGTEWFIRITGDAEDYSAEISIDGNWHQVCGEPGTKSAVKIIAYPNPVSVGDNLTLQLPDSFTGGYANVISLSGATVKQRLPLPDRVSTVNVSDCSPGIYLLSIISPDGNSETVKIAINN